VDGRRPGCVRCDGVNVIQVEVEDDGTDARAAGRGNGADVDIQAAPSDTNAVIDVFVFDRKTSTTTRVSLDSSGNQAAGGSGMPSISGLGGYVSFNTDAALVPEDTNNATDIYVSIR
jgi:hypothetical protein